MKDLFHRVTVREFIEMNWRSATFECWVYHFELNNPLSACISYSNKSMKREIWKLNLELNRMCDFVVYCFCLAFNIPLPVSTRKDINIARSVIKQFQSLAKFSWRKRLYAEVGLERARMRIKQGTNRARFSSIAEWDVRLFIHSLSQKTEAQNFNAFFDNAVKSKEALRSEIKSDSMSRSFRWNTL